MSETLESFLNECIRATGEKGVAVNGMVRSQLPAAIRSIRLNDYTNINYLLSDILGETVTDAFAGLAKVKAIKESERQAIIAKGTLVTLQDAFSAYANKIRAIQSYADLTYSGIMPSFILDTEPTGSTIVYMRPGATGDGSSWANATGDFIAAHASLSGSKNVIYMEEGVYPVTGTITLKSSIKIYGGFKASDHAWSSRNGLIYRTILDAQLAHLQLTGNATCILGSLTIINARNTQYSPFTSITNGKNLITQDCVLSGNYNGGGFASCTSCNNIIAINNQAYGGGGFANITNCNNIIAINNKATTNGGGINGATGCNNLLMLNNQASNQGGGAYSLTNCAGGKFVNCTALGSGGGTINDNNCKNFLFINCTGAQATYGPINCQNYTFVNNICTSAVAISGNSTLPAAKIYNFICLNNKNSTGSLVSMSLVTANYYYKIYNCRADTAITFVANSATNADIKNFALVQNDNSNTKFSNVGTYPVAGPLPYENAVINQKYIDGNFGNFNIPTDSVLSGAGYWEDGFSFGWDIDGKARTSTHCSIGCYEPHWA